MTAASWPPWKRTCKTYEEALLEIYRKLRPGEPPTVEIRGDPAQRLFFDPRRYDLSTVGRYKFNKKLAIWPAPGRQKLAAARGRPATGEILAEAGDAHRASDARDAGTGASTR